MRNLTLNQQAIDDLLFWAKNVTKLLRKVFDLFKDCLSNPFNGIGKPEALRRDLRGYWSRRINLEHRMVYTVTDDAIIIISCRSRYN